MKMLCDMSHPPVEIIRHIFLFLFYDISYCKLQKLLETQVRDVLFNGLRDTSNDTLCDFRLKQPDNYGADDPSFAALLVSSTAIALLSRSMR